jgi:hypothetical protein
MRSNAQHSATLGPVPLICDVYSSVGRCVDGGTKIEVIPPPEKRTAQDYQRLTQSNKRQRTE